MTDPTASFSLLPSFNSASIGTSTTGPATSYSASDTVSYSEMPPLSKPSGQAYQLEGQLQLEESVQASKPPQTSTVSCEHNFINMMYKHCDIFSDSPATVSNTVKVMPASIKGTIVQNVCSASPAEIGATTLLVTTSTPAVSYSEMPPLSKPSGQAYQLEGQLQLEESVQASKPPQTSTVSCEHNFINMMYKHCDIFSDSPATVSNTVKVMPASIKGTIVQNVCSASPAEIGATTLLVTTSTPAVSYSEMPPLSKPSGQAYQLEGQLQLEESVQASKPPQTSTVSCEHNFINMMYKHCDIFSDSPATVSNTVKVMPASIKGTIVQNVCSASPAEIGASTLLVTTSTPAVCLSEMPPVHCVSPRQCKQQVTNNGALGKDNTGTCI